MSLEQLEKEILTQISEAKALQRLEEIRVGALGKSGRISELMKTLGTLSPEERRERGEVLNGLRERITAALKDRQDKLKGFELAARLNAETLDITLSARHSFKGSIHPIMQAQFEVMEIFSKMGFCLADGPDIETDFYNFEALNFPHDHPARQAQDTFYLPNNTRGEKMVLRTHTSPVQIRTMMEAKPPLRIMATGRVYRSDFDQTHTPTFHQLEGFVIDKAIHMGHLKGCLIQFCRDFFEREDLPVRFRPSFFPFTEPSAEVDIGCSRSGGAFAIGPGADWLEILGCGMIHPNVLKNCGVDPTVYQGFAFGVGIERIAMLKYGITDLRAFYEGDLRWHKHYGFSAFESFMRRRA